MGFFKSNFTRIAENTTKYYLELRNNYRDRFKDEASLLATAGVLDAQNYIFVSNPQITVAEILDAANAVISHKNNIVNEIAYFKRKAAQSSGMTFADFITDDSKWRIDPLTGFIIALEVKIFESVSNISTDNIVEACSQKLKDITKTVQKTRDKYVSERMFALATANLMESSQFEAIRNQLGIKEMKPVNQGFHSPQKNSIDKYQYLISRKGWKKLGEEVCKQIADAFGQDDKLFIEFVNLSEGLGLLKDNYLKQAKDTEDTSFVVWLMAITVYRSGNRLMEFYNQSNNIEHLMSAISLYTISLTLNKNYVMGYGSLSLALAMKGELEEGKKYLNKGKRLLSKLRESPELLNIHEESVIGEETSIFLNGIGNLLKEMEREIPSD